MKQLAERKDAPIVIATARKPKEAKELNALAAKHANVKVLEARDRVGGKTWSKPVQGSVCDVGAAWINDTNRTCPRPHLSS